MRSAVAAVAVAIFMVAGSVAVTPAAEKSPSFEHVHALGFDAAGHALWLGAHTGLYRSEDGGRTWAKATLPAQGHGPDVMAIAAHPTDANVVYVGTHEAGVLKTTDGGSTWSVVNTGLRGLDVHGLAVDPNAPAKLHALVREQGAGLYRTTDGGAKWVRVDDGPAGETKVLASVNIPTGMGGIFLYAGTGDGLHRNPDCF
jgi:photosystem II stability/assembly factor-like uncharacterized protein